MKKSFIGISISMLVCLALATNAQPFRPVNPRASQEVRDLLSYLYSLQSNQILSGQHNYGHELTRSTDSIINYTGKCPVVWGSDLMTFDFGQRMNRHTIMDEAINQHRKGAIITLMYHQNRPYDPDTARTTWEEVTDREWQDLVNPGTAIHQQWLNQIDSIAFYLKILQEENIPVLWRPYHEMNGLWFWWGGKPGPDGLQKLWKLMYHRFIDYHQLNNLIWVWNANAPRERKDDNAMDYHLFYPGGEYVDVLAADIYHGDYKQSHHDQLVELGKGKPIAMGEIGEVPPPAILDQQPQWAWFMIWARFPWSKNSLQQINALYQHPKVLTKDEITIKPNKSTFNWNQYYKPSNKKRWYIAPQEGPVVGNQDGKYLGPMDLLPGDFHMTGTVEGLQKNSFDLMQANCAWGKFTYRITPLQKIKFKTFTQAIPGQKEFINSRSIPVEDVAKIKTNLNLSGTITAVVENGKSFLVELNFTNKEPVKCRMELISSSDMKRQPDVRLRYGPHWKHGMDFYYPAKKTDKPLAAVVFIHGGGWSALDKAAKGETVQWYNDHGMAYISVNYRYVSMHEEHPAVKPPVAASLLDAARAIQTIRYRSKELGIDPERLGITGGSAGGATCTWLALHDDLANPESGDPVERMSTKPTCAIPVQAQTTIDPKRMQEWITSITYGAHAFFDRSILPEKGPEQFQFFMDQREDILPWIKEFSSYRHATPDDPPILLNYLMRKNTIPAENAGHATHHPRFGSKLHERLIELGVDSHFISDDDVRSEKYTNWWGEKLFFLDKLDAWDESGLSKEDN